MIAVIALGVVVLVLLARRRHAGFLGAWCFITLAPTSSIVPIATEVGADRRMYLPLAGLVVLLVLSAYRAWTSRATARLNFLGPAVAIGVCVLLLRATISEIANMSRSSRS